MTGTPGDPDPPPSPPALPLGTFRIDREGTWRHEGQEVTHPGVLANLWANLRVDRRIDGDTHYLQVGPLRIPVEVVAAPFVVTRIEVQRGRDGMLQGLWGQLSDSTSEALRPESFWLDDRDTPFCRVKDERFGARLSVAAWLQLAPWLEPGASPTDVVLVIGGRRIPLPRRPRE